MTLKIKSGASLNGLHPIMRPVLREADRIWQQHGQQLVITCGTDGEHSAESWHYYGLALDLRTNFWENEEAELVYTELKDALPEYDIIYHKGSHIHGEIGNALASTIGALY